MEKLSEIRKAIGVHMGSQKRQCFTYPYTKEGLDAVMPSRAAVELMPRQTEETARVEAALFVSLCVCDVHIQVITRVPALTA
jgi:hypothetical protein